MMMDLDVMEKKIHSTPKDVKRGRSGKDNHCRLAIQSAVNHRK